MPRKKKGNPDQSMSIFFILDGSGSMSGVQDDVIGGVNEFIELQKKEPGQTTFSLTVFDTSVNKVYDAEPIANVKEVNRAITFRGGGTALLDAVGKTLADAEGANLPGKKLVVIYTDGHENSSTEFKNDDIKKLISRLEQQGDWTFTYMSADVDNFDNARAIGVAAGNYVMTSSGTTRGNFSTLSRASTAHRVSPTMSSKNFAEEYNVNAAEAAILQEQGGLVLDKDNQQE